LEALLVFPPGLVEFELAFGVLVVLELLAFLFFLLEGE
jgi:hypothetical protein